MVHRIISCCNEHDIPLIYHIGIILGLVTDQQVVSENAGVAEFSIRVLDGSTVGSALPLLYSTMESEAKGMLLVIIFLCY